ncbi:glycosyltransferase family 4 protein [Amycolatopsis keratiniphila]|uniref:glycosyltransferase family 4 protein n=1 Tax=Amycolatopsis keratiniphila TaxID=129921 RepID=UPI00087B2595|nr:glycosyltransferase family 4 protein [Amycolatopsis keratiniphila]SDU46271.1 Glycosyltransferase involved in cell wall bisynthesis [Amycolatopsis keratiniphila]
MFTSNVRVTEPVVFVLPGETEDVSGEYDRRMCQNLPATGLPLLELPIAGEWPMPGPLSRSRLARSLAALPDDTVVLIDGTVACGVPEIVVPHARRLRLAVLVHRPLADDPALDPAQAAELDACERETLRLAGMIVATGPWLARQLIDRHDLDPTRVYVATPGTDAAPLAAGADGVSRLLCLAPMTARHGQDVLIRALSMVDELAFKCVFAGATHHDPAYVDELRWTVERLGLGSRISLIQPPDDLDLVYDGADLLVLPARGGTSGLVVAEALARGIPVVATETAGAHDALGTAPGGGVPGMLVPPNNPSALAAALLRWSLDAELRHSLRTSALARSSVLEEWDVAAGRLTDVLSRLQAAPRQPV